MRRPRRGLRAAHLVAQQHPAPTENAGSRAPAGADRPPAGSTTATVAARPAPRWPAPAGVPGHLAEAVQRDFACCTPRTRRKAATCAVSAPAGRRHRGPTAAAASPNATAPARPSRDSSRYTLRAACGSPARVERHELGPRAGHPGGQQQAGDRGDRDRATDQAIGLRVGGPYDQRPVDQPGQAEEAAIARAERQRPGAAERPTAGPARLHPTRRATGASLHDVEAGGAAGCATRGRLSSVHHPKRSALLAPAQLAHHLAGRFARAAARAGSRARSSIAKRRFSGLAGST